MAYLDLENFDPPAGDTTCGPAVQAFVRGFSNALHGAGDTAGVYFNAHHGATTIVPMYGQPGAPDDVWVANWDGSATAGDASIAGKWPHHRIHQYYSDGSNGNPLETYGGETINVDRDAIDGDVVTAKSVSIAGYNGNDMGAYVEFRDERVAFFVRSLGRGKHSVSYRLRAEIPGRFSALPTKASAMYAPELKANSDEIKLRIFDAPSVIHEQAARENAAAADPASLQRRSDKNR